MNPESKTRLVTIAEIGALVAVLIIGILVGWYLSRGGSSSQTPDGTGANSQTGGTPTSATAAPVDNNVHVPDAGETAAAGVAVPSVVTEAAPGVEAKARTYSVSVKNNEFSPATIAAHVGDTISVNFLAEDKDYDFTQPDLGLSAKLLKGKNQLIQVSPTQTGKFTFYCASCGGPAKGPVGYLVVAPKQ